MRQALFTPEEKNFKEKLSEIGLKTEWTKIIADRVLFAFNQATSNDAKSAAGTKAYLEAVRAIRDVLLPKGWKKVQKNNLEITRNKTTGVSLLVSSGNKGTGDKNKTPKTRNTKGEQTKKIVYKNAMELPLFPSFEAKNTRDIHHHHNWFLLYHIDKDKKQMRFEISLPVEMDSFGMRITEWRERIILPAIDFETAPVLVPQEQEFAEDVELEVKRKSNDR
jgi:hypothetical protein